MKITVSEYAKREGISRQAAYQRIKKQGLSVENGLIEVDDGLQSVDNVVDNAVDNEVDSGLQHEQTANDTMCAVLSDTIAVLTAQLEVKDKQIEALNERLKDVNLQLTTALQQTSTAQALQAGTIQQALQSECNRSERRHWWSRNRSKE